jgi:ArsR family transcriptional regulator
MDIATTAQDEPRPQLLRTPVGGNADGPQAAPAAPAAVPGVAAAEWPNYQQSPAIAAVLRLLGDTTRLRLLFLLVAGERSVTELHTRLGTSQPTVSHHLAWLRASNLVVSRRQRKHTYYALGPAVVIDGGSLAIGALRIRLGGDA